LIPFILAPVAVVALVVLAISPAGASHGRAGGTCHAITRITHVTTHRTKTSIIRSERVIAYPAARCGAASLWPRTAQGECKWNEELNPDKLSSKGVLNGRDWTDDCTGAASCAQGADMQWRTPGGDWDLLKAGSQTNGCVEAAYAWVNVRCFSDPAYNAYRDLGTFTIVWDDGDITGPDQEPSPSLTLQKMCG
jgi:hypothetical protein